MSERPTVLFVGENGEHWQLGGIGADGKPDVRDVDRSAAGVGVAVRASGGARSGIVLSLPSEWCMSATVELAGIPGRNRRAALLYRMEEKLPLSAEEVVGDFIERDGAALGVCVPRERLVPLLEALGGEGVVIRLVCPTALLALQSMPPGGTDATVWQRGPQCDVFVHRGGGSISAWFTTAADAAEIALHLRLSLDNGGDEAVVHLRAIDVDAELLANLSKQPQLAVTDTVAQGQREAAVTAAAEALTGGALTTVDFKRGLTDGESALGRLRSPIAAALAGACLLLLTLLGSALWRARAYEALTQTSEASQVALYSALHPGSRIPQTAGIRRRLESEHGRLIGPRPGAAAEGPSPLLLLRDVLASLPAEVRFRLFEVRVAPDEVFIDGEARSHGDADAIAAALRRVPGLAVEPPGTQQLDARSVSFRIAAAPASGDAAIVADGGKQ